MKELPPEVLAVAAAYRLCDAGWTTMGELRRLSLNDIDMACAAFEAFRADE